jgi:glycerate kinase
MKIVLAPDSFKGSLSAAEICEAMEAGVRKVLPQAEIVKIPMADGGEGTVTALVAATGGRFEQTEVVGPLGKPVCAEYGILGDGTTAVIEMASASGLPLVPIEKRNPMRTTTYGTGQLILEALGQGCSRLIIGIGGSATTDCGTGMAQALGVQFYRPDGSRINEYMTGARMGEVGGIGLAEVTPLLGNAELTVACDVENPLLGPHGAVMVYSRQKGASDEQLTMLEENMERVIYVVEQTLGRSIREIPGSGAAGGLGAGLIAFAHAQLCPGVRLVMEACSFARKIAGAALIFAGEGRVDLQTAFGKTISGVVAEASKQSIPVIVVAGNVQDEAENLYHSGVSSMFSICSGPMSLENAVSQTAQLVEKCVERILRAIVRIKLDKAD